MPAKTAKSSGRTLSSFDPGGQTGPSSPTARATIAAVTAASPVAITVRTPNVRSSATSFAESVRGGSLSAMIPASRNAGGGPTATARTLNPCDSSSFAAVESVGDDWTRPATTAKAPFTTRRLAPFASTTVASDIFVAGSNGTNAIPFGRSVATLCAAAARMAASTGSCPPSEPASAASPRTCASSKPARDGRRSPSARCMSACPSCPRTGRPSKRPRPPRRDASAEHPGVPDDRAPTAAARVKVAGSATGIDARTAVSTSGIISASGME